MNLAKASRSAVYLRVFAQILSKSEEQLPADEVVERVMRKGREKADLYCQDTKNFVDGLANLGRNSIQS